MLQDIGHYPIQAFKVCQIWVVIPFRSWTRGFQSVILPLKTPIKCHFIDNWFAGVPFLCYRYYTKQICICFQQSRFIARNEIG
jgi:hypothetical protein